MKKRYAALIALVLACLAYGVVVFSVGDGVFWSTGAPPGRESRAALAIRDDVTPFQKWGSRVFTWGYLDRYYDAAWYFTQAHKGDSKEEFVACLDNALERYPAVDLYLLAHTNKYVEWAEELPRERRERIRFVYNTGCHDQKQGQRWIDLGAKTYVGHPGVTWSPVFYYFFMRRWTRDESVREATDQSNPQMEWVLRNWERITFGRWNAAALIAETKASCIGDGGIRLEDCRR